jgi:hypothetical protein
VKGIRSLVALAGAVLTILVVTPRLAVAAPQAAAATVPPANQAPGKSRKVAPTKFLRLEEMRVEGRIQKPQAMFLMPRANLNLGELDRSDPFLPKVSKAVTKSPF